jgi:thiosulfate/3-mercaptopyruvate sulfurtransferase
MSSRRRRPLTVLAAGGDRGLALALCLLPGCRQVEPGAAPHFPARDVPRFEGLVSVSWLKAVLDHHDPALRAPRPPTYRQERFVVLEASWATLEAAKDYHAGHIPGAIHFNTDDLETGSPRWRLREVEDLHRVFGQAGITPETCVIVHGRRLIAAARVWWALKYAGVSDVRILDGGFEAWRAAGYPVETTIRKLRPVSFAGPVAPGMLATTEYVHERLGSSDVWLADVRSEAEFRGRSSGYAYLDAVGRIPGAVHAGDADDGARLYVRGDGRLRAPAEILEHWRRQGIVPAAAGERLEREVIFYCGGGWRSSLAFFHAWLLGFENIRNYSDGWSGWSTRYIEDPAARGATPGWRQEPTGRPIAVGAL